MPTPSPGCTGTSRKIAPRVAIIGGRCVVSRSEGNRQVGTSPGRESGKRGERAREDHTSRWEVSSRAGTSLRSFLISLKSLHLCREAAPKGTARSPHSLPGSPNVQTCYTGGKASSPLKLLSTFLCIDIDIDIALSFPIGNDAALIPVPTVDRVDRKGSIREAAKDPPLSPPRPN